MNACHIGDIAVTPLCFCINCPLTPTSITVGHPSSLWRGGGGADPNQIIIQNEKKN
jgi:hypothetical protein